MQDQDRVPAAPMVEERASCATGEGFADLYGELREIAGRLFRSQGPNHTLQATALVNEAYLKMASGASAGYRDREHLLAVAATAMRQILVNHARDRAALKRGGGGTWRRVTLSGLSGEEGDFAEVLAVDEALRELDELAPRQARITGMRFFGGMTNREIAAALAVSLRTVELDWTMAKAWLAGRLDGNTGS